MRILQSVLIILLAASALAGCATSRDTHNIAVRNAALLEPSTPEQVRYLPEISEGNQTVFLRKQNAKKYLRQHTKDEYERFAFQLPDGYNRNERIDVNTPGVNFRYTTGTFEGNWLYNGSQEGFLWVHRETDTTVEVCLEVNIDLKWGQTYQLNTPEDAMAEPAGKVELQRFYVFKKNDRRAYMRSNQIPSMGAQIASDDVEVN